MLNDRRAAILRSVVEQYIETAQPVGSSRVVSSGKISVSAATVRNEMMSLEQDGFITQPHTSAGRIPTEKGYRFFVDHLDGSPGLQPQQEQQIGQFFERTTGELEQLLRDATSLVARLTATTAVVVGPQEQSAKIRSVQLVALSDHLVMLVVVLSNGAVVKPRIEMAGAVDDDVIDSANRALSMAFRGKVATAITRPADTGDADVDLLTSLAFERLLNEVTSEHAQIYVDGASNMARSFDGVRMVGEILALLEQQLVVTELLRELMSRQVSVAIGSETGVRQLSECSLVLAPVVAGDSRAGTVAVLGPTRMNYAETLAAVAVVSDRLGRALVDGV